MSIQKKSLINTLKTAKKANVVKEEATVSARVAPRVSASTKKFSPSKRAASKAAASKRLRVPN
jgi:hypothetical protein